MNIKIYGQIVHDLNGIKNFNDKLIYAAEHGYEKLVPTLIDKVDLYASHRWMEPERIMH